MIVEPSKHTWPNEFVELSQKLIKKHISIPPERTTGKHDTQIKAGGAIPGGIQKGFKELGIPDLALFHDPITGSTLALPTDSVSAKMVKEHIQKSRRMYMDAEDRAAKNKADKRFRTRQE